MYLLSLPTTHCSLTSNKKNYVLHFFFIHSHLLLVVHIIDIPFCRLLMAMIPRRFLLMLMTLWLVLLLKEHHHQTILATSLGTSLTVPCHPPPPKKLVTVAICLVFTQKNIHLQSLVFLTPNEMLQLFLPLLKHHTSQRAPTRIRIVSLPYLPPMKNVRQSQLPFLWRAPINLPLPRLGPM